MQFNDYEVQSPEGAIICENRDTDEATTPTRTTTGMISQARLMVHAHLTDELECAQWCATKGLIGRMECRRHRKPRKLARESTRHGIR